MAFNSVAFFTFFAIVYPLYLVLTHRWQNRLILGASLFFCGFSDWRFLPVLLASTGLTYGAALLVEGSSSANRRRTYLILSLLAHLSLLGAFKYTVAVLPLGISFYTFQAISYLVDAYRGDLKACRSLETFSLYQVFFPRLLAGPIEKGKRFISQIEKPRTITFEGVGHGLYLFSWGFIKKVAIADNVRAVPDFVFGHYQQLSATEIWLGCVGFLLRMYCDFSGYTDMARGIAKMMGFELSLNFRLPFFATNPADFWNRWHISLSNWLREYVYYPVFARSKSIVGTILLTFLLMGVWHGAGWNFVLVGLYWGLAVTMYSLLQPFLHRFTARLSPSGLTAFRCVSIVANFQLTCLGVMFVGTTGLAGAMGMLGGLATHGWAWSALASQYAVKVGFYLLFLLSFEIPQYLSGNPELFLARGRMFRFSVAVATLYLVALIYIFEQRSFLGIRHEFIYSQF